MQKAKWTESITREQLLPGSCRAPFRCCYLSVLDTIDHLEDMSLDYASMQRALAALKTVQEMGDRPCPPLAPLPVTRTDIETCRKKLVEASEAMAAAKRADAPFEKQGTEVVQKYERRWMAPFKSLANAQTAADMLATELSKHSIVIK